LTKMGRSEDGRLGVRGTGGVSRQNALFSHTDTPDTLVSFDHITVPFASLPQKPHCAACGVSGRGCASRADGAHAREALIDG
jgi:hypothetical protein